MNEVTKVVSAENAPINSSMNYAKKYEASYEDSGGGSGGGALVVNVTVVDNVLTCDKTAGEIWAACQTGLVIFRCEYDVSEAVEPLGGAYLESEGGYEFIFGNNYVTADTENDYPTSGGSN